MSALNTPLQLATAFKPKIWGREDLSPIYPAREENDSPVCKKVEISEGAWKPGELIGEVWAIDDTSRFLNGPVAGLTLAEVSARCGIDWPALSRLENGHNRNPTLDTLWRYAAAVGRRLLLSTARVSSSEGHAIGTCPSPPQPR